MTILELHQTAAIHAPAATRLLPRLQRLWLQFVARHRQRRLMSRLSRLSPERLRDMGFDPAAVYAAVRGTWDELSDARLPPEQRF